MRDLTQHLTARADDSHAPPVYLLPEGHPPISKRFKRCQDLVRFLALRRIKPHAPPLVRVPVNSFEFHSCERTPQAGYLLRLLRHGCLTTHTQYPSFTARTTRVSNPVCSPSFRTLASVSVQRATFVIGIPTNIYAFHRYTCSSALLSRTLAIQFQKQFQG